MAERAIVTLMSREGEAEVVRVVLVDDTNNAYGGQAVVSDELPVHRAAVAALRDAFEAQQRGPGPWLELRGEPSAASVSVNDAPVGILPYV